MIIRGARVSLPARHIDSLLKEDVRREPREASCMTRIYSYRQHHYRNQHHNARRAQRQAEKEDGDYENCVLSHTHNAASER
jgi:hypothetical protein